MSCCSCSQPVLFNYIGFPGLVQVAAESECGASLHGHRKCSQAGCPLVNGDLAESALERDYTYESASPETQRGTCATFTLTCNPVLPYVHAQRGIGRDVLDGKFSNYDATTILVRASRHRLILRLRSV